MQPAPSPQRIRHPKWLGRTWATLGAACNMMSRPCEASVVEQLILMVKPLRSANSASEVLVRVDLSWQSARTSTPSGPRVSDSDEN